MGDDQDSSANERWFKKQEGQSFKANQEVFAFFNSNHQDQNHRPVKVEERSDAAPLVGMSAGWCAAIVLEDYSYDSAKPSERVHLRFTGHFRDTCEKPSDNLEMYVDPRLIKENKPDQPTPILSILVIRMWDYTTKLQCAPPEHGGTSDSMIRELFEGECGVHELLAGEYEVHTVWVQGSQDLTKLNIDQVRSRLSNRTNITGWYFLYPVRRKEDELRKAGSNWSNLVGEYEFFTMCQKLERAGIPTGWPHISYLYRQLVGRLWVPQMSLNQDYKVPTTTRVHYAEFAEVQEDATMRAMECIKELRPSTGSPFQGNSGIVKLGFTEPDDEELHYTDRNTLRKRLDEIFRQPGSMQIVCLVQEEVSDVLCELRYVLINDALNNDTVKKPVWVRSGKTKAAGSETMTQEEALSEAFDGNNSLMSSARSSAENIIERWMLWFTTECPEPPQVARVDFWVVQRSKASVEVWTRSLGECGTDMYDVPLKLRNVACINSAMRNDESFTPFALPSA